jgi:transcriptional regulator with XRE-family HTH domain
LTGRRFTDRIRELRQKRGLTQAQMAERCGVPQARMSELEKGESAPTLVTIIWLAIAENDHRFETV